MASKQSAGSKTRVESVRHKDKRKNIPTEELRGFMDADENAPKKMLYPRDPSLDPQLVWKGKDEQDAADLEVPTVPIYIQEKIHPQALIEDLRARSGEDDAQFSMFSDFNGISFEEQIDFYRHEQHWQNRMILGDSLLVMNSLAEKEGMKGTVQTIYIDPPYGIKFGSNWQVSTRKKDVTDGRAEDTTHQPEQIKAFRDTWSLGIHSYLSYLRDRFVIARELLTESGSLFVQIGDENLHLVRCLLDEVFGNENFVLTIVVKKKGATTPTDPVNDYLVWFAKDKENLKVRRLYLDRALPEDDTKFNTLISPNGEHVRIKDLNNDEINNLIDNGYKWARVNYPIVSQHPHASRSKDFKWNGKSFSCGSNRQWSFDPEKGLLTVAHAGRVFDGGGNSLGGVVYWKDWHYVAMSNLWEDLHGEQELIYVVQTNRKIVERCLIMTTDPGDLVLDPTCGSGTTAFVAEQWGRRWITTDTSRVALALARTRLMAAKLPYYLLTDSTEGIKKEAELTGKVMAQQTSDNDIRKGFVYERAPHITLKSIANNVEIDDTYAKWQKILDPLLSNLNKQIKKQWQEWEVPRETEKGWSASAIKLHEQYWKARRDRQKEIDESIDRRADTEMLYDKPYEDKKRIRVAGPFTVESLSPHRVLSTDEEMPATEIEAQSDGNSDFASMIIENLRKAGVQNTKRGERLQFDRLEPFAGTWLHAEGEYTENEKPKRVAVCIGPEHGTVGGELIKDAAVEAKRGAGFDLLVVCGFAFDANVLEETKLYGNLRVMPARMNPDLAMGGELLKKTGSGNLFMVFGEPDVDIQKQDDGNLVVEIKGVDIYDPTTGQIKSDSTDDIACWFIDTDYNGQSFFVRHAYFTGTGDPYDKLKRALRADINEAAWSSIYSTKSRPFKPPTKGKLAIKVINHYGDEVLKVYDTKG